MRGENGGFFTRIDSLDATLNLGPLIWIWPRPMKP
jgi:hypothetical protein